MTGDVYCCHLKRALYDANYILSNYCLSLIHIRWLFLLCIALSGQLILTLASHCCISLLLLSLSPSPLSRTVSSLCFPRAPLAIVLPLYSLPTRPNKGNIKAVSVQFTAKYSSYSLCLSVLRPHTEQVSETLSCTSLVITPYSTAETARKRENKKKLHQHVKKPSNVCKRVKVTV